MPLGLTFVNLYNEMYAFTQDLTVQIQATAIFTLLEHEAHKHLQTN